LAPSLTATNEEEVNQVGPGAEPWGDQPYCFLQLPHLKKASAKFSAATIEHK
jgi:hypothetical protein